MKSTVIEPRNNGITMQKPEYPALFKHHDGSIVLAISSLDGVYLFAGEGSTATVGCYLKDSFRPWHMSKLWTRLEEPITVTIRFEP